MANSVTGNALAAGTGASTALAAIHLDHLIALDGATQKYPEQAVADSIIAKMIAKGDPATPSTFDCTTDSLQALSDKLGGMSGDGGAAQDDSVKASLDLAHIDLDAILADTDAMFTLSQTEGTLTADGTEQNIVINNAPAGVFKPLVIKISLENMEAGDTTVIKVYDRMVAAGDLEVMDVQTYTGADGGLADGRKGIYVTLQPNKNGFKVTLNCDHARDFRWEYLYEA